MKNNMDLKTKFAILCMEQATPFASKKRFMALLKAKLGDSYDKLNNENKKMLKRASEAMEQAYKMGLSDGKIGNPMTIEIDDRMKNKLETGSELTHAVCDLLIQAYTSGYEIGKAEYEVFGEEVSTE